MNVHLFIDLIVFLNIYCMVWAQTLNNETTTQLPGNTEPLAIEMTQTPKTGDNSTEYENTTTIQTNDLDSSDKKPIDLVSINNTFMTTTAVTPKAIKVLEISTEGMESETTTTAVSPIDMTNSSIDAENETPVIESVIDSGNSSSLPIVVNEGEEQTTSVVSTTHTSIVSTDQPNDSTESLATNITSVFTELIKTSKAMNFSDQSTDERNDSFNYISDANNETIVKTSNKSEESYANSPSTESSAINNMSGDNSTASPNMTQNSQNMNSSSPQMRGTTQLNEINSRQTIETSTHKPSAETTPRIQTTTINTFIASNSMPKIEELPQITQIPINSSESQTPPNHFYISSAPELSQTPINQNRQNQTLFETSTDIPQNSNTNASDITAPVGAQIDSHEPQVHTIPKMSTISTSEERHNVTDSLPMITNSEQKQRETQTTPQTETERPNTITVSESTHSVRQFSNTQRQSKSEPMQRETKPLIELLQTSASTATQPKPTTHIPNHSTLTLNSSQPTVRLTESPTQSESSQTQRESQMTTDSNIEVKTANESDPSINSETTLKEPSPLTDHSLKTTINQNTKPTAFPPESNISEITVTLPNIMYISSISKEDMVNIVTITFIAKSIDIFRWVSVYDQIFRNFTCNRINPERDWCSIDRFIYLSPSPIVVDNHMIINFVINDSPNNNLNIFGGPLIVEALKNSTSSLETMMAMKVMSLQTNLGTMVVKPLDNSPERLAKFELLVFVFTVVMFICTALLCLAVICSCAKRKSVDMNQIHLSNAGRRHTHHTPLNGGFDLNSASNILRDENQEKLNNNVINLDGWVAPIEQVDNQKIKAYDNLEDTKL